MVCLFGIVGAAYFISSSVDIFIPNEKLYVAVEGEGAIAVIDTAKRKVIRKIDLSVEHDGGTVLFRPHNVQVAPDGQSIWVTANSGTHEGHSFLHIPEAFAHGEEIGGAKPDEIIVINPYTDQIEHRIPVAAGIHLAHVVVDAKGEYAYVTAQKEGTIYRVRIADFSIERLATMDLKDEPHGVRLSVDGKIGYVAMLGSKSIGMLDLSSGTLKQVPMGGAAVQTGVTADGKYALVSLYDTKSLGIYRTSDGGTSSVALPDGARGPVQMYPTPDSKFVYLADQGYYFNQGTHDEVYKLDIAGGLVIKAIRTGAAPHGVVVSQDGAFVYVTNLLDESVTVIDTSVDEVVATIQVGKEPNGVSIWSKKLGGTP